MLAAPPLRPDPPPGATARPALIGYVQTLPAVDVKGRPIRGLRFRCHRLPSRRAHCRPFWLAGAHRRPVKFPRRVVLDGVVFLIESG